MVGLRRSTRNPLGYLTVLSDLFPLHRQIRIRFAVARTSVSALEKTSCAYVAVLLAMSRAQSQEMSRMQITEGN